MTRIEHIYVRHVFYYNLNIDMSALLCIVYCKIYCDYLLYRFCIYIDTLRRLIEFICKYG